MPPNNIESLRPSVLVTVDATKDDNNAARTSSKMDPLMSRHLFKYKSTRIKSLQVNKARVTPSDIQHSAAYSDLRVLQIGIRAKVIENQPVTPPSPDYIPGLEDPQTPPVPQDEDEREPMFVQAHDPDYVSEPIYPELNSIEMNDMSFPLRSSHYLQCITYWQIHPGYVTEIGSRGDPKSTDE
ncbi:hypothetical protein Tco_0469853 [Tanacetum coccineum]